MGGYAKIDKNKIQPSPTLAALTGFLSGLNTKKKELQDREDAQNKQAVDWYKAVQEMGIKERETVVKEKEMQTDADYKASIITKANEDVNTSRAVETRAKEKWLFDKIPLEAQSNPNHPFNIAQREIKKADLWNQALNELKKQEKLDELKFGKDYVNTGSYRREQEIQLEFKKKEIDAQNVSKYTPSIQTNKGLVSPAQLQQDIETTGQLLVEGARAKIQKEITGAEIAGRATQGELNRKMDLEIANIRASGGDKIPEVKTLMDLSEEYRKETAMTTSQYTDKTTGATNIPDFEIQRLDSLYNQVVVAHQALPKEYQSKLSLPLQLTKTGEGKGGVSIPIIGKVGAKSGIFVYTNPVISNRINIIRSNMDEIKKSARSSGKNVRQYLEDNGEPIEAIDAVLGKGKKG